MSYEPKLYVWTIEKKGNLWNSTTQSLHLWRKIASRTLHLQAATHRKWSCAPLRPCNYPSISIRTTQHLCQKAYKVYSATPTIWVKKYWKITALYLATAFRFAWSDVSAHSEKPLWLITSLKIPQAGLEVSVVRLLCTNWAWSRFWRKRTDDNCNFRRIIWFFYP